MSASLSKMCISNYYFKMYSWRQQSARLSFIPTLLRSSRCTFGIQILTFRTLYRLIKKSSYAPRSAKGTPLADLVDWHGFPFSETLRHYLDRALYLYLVALWRAGLLKNGNYLGHELCFVVFPELTDDFLVFVPLGDSKLSSL